jgi:hypothetical protein
LGCFAKRASLGHGNESSELAKIKGNIVHT